MDQTAFYGRIYTADSGIVKNTLREWLHTHDLHEKLKLSGEQIVYEDARIYVYCYEDSGTEPGREKFLVEGHTSDSLDLMRQQLQTLLDLFRQKNIRSTFECVVVDESGHEVSDLIDVS